MGFEQKLNQAANLARAGRFDETEHACRQLLKKKPQSFDVLQLLGLAQARQGRAAEAIATFRRAVDADRRHAGVRNNLGNALMDLGRLQEAHDAFLRATELAPTTADAYVGLGRARIRLGRFEDAKRTLERALRYAPTLVEAYDALGYCLMRVGQLEAATQHHLRALDQDPPVPSAFVNLFNTLMFRQVTDDARRVAEAGVRDLPPASPQTAELEVGLAKLAWIEGRLDDLQVALDASESILTCFDDYPNVDNLRVFHRYLRWLLGFRRHYRGDAYGGEPTKALFFISESHGFGPSETVVCLDDEPRRVLTILVTGCKAFHLGRTEGNEYQASVRAALRAIPEGHPVVFGFGEIDSRADEGIIKAHHTKGQDYREAVPPMVDAYVKFAVDAARAKQHTPLFYGVPAPSPQVTARCGPDHCELLVSVIRTFNESLRGACERYGSRLLDVYAHTVNAEGTAAAGHHVDDYHVHPETLRAILQRVSRRP